MERVKDLCSGSGALWLWKLSGRLENQPHLICMTDSKRVLNIACPLFQVNTSATGLSRKWHPSKIGCKNKIVKSEENKKNHPKGDPTSPLVGNALTAATSMPEA